MNIFRKRQFDWVQERIKKVTDKLSNCGSKDFHKMWDKELEPLLKERDKFIK